VGLYSHHPKHSQKSMNDELFSLSSFTCPQADTQKMALESMFSFRRFEKLRYCSFLPSIW